MRKFAHTNCLTTNRNNIYWCFVGIFIIGIAYLVFWLVDLLFWLAHFFIGKAYLVPLSLFGMVYLLRQRFY